MIGQWAVTTLACHRRVLPILLYIQDVRMTAFAGLMAGVDNGLGGNFLNRVPAKMAILPKTLGHEKGAQQKKKDESGYKNRGQPV